MDCSGPYALRASARPVYAPDLGLIINRFSLSSQKALPQTINCLETLLLGI